MSIEDRGVVVDVIDVDVHTHVAVTSCRSENKHFMRWQESGFTQINSVLQAYDLQVSLTIRIACSNKQNV